MILPIPASMNLLVSCIASDTDMISSFIEEVPSSVLSTDAMAMPYAELRSSIVTATIAKGMLPFLLILVPLFVILNIRHV